MTAVQILSFHGELDMASKGAIERQLDRIAFTDAALTVVLDLRRVTYIDTTFLNALVVAGRNRPPRARICIVAEKRLELIFRFTGLSREFSLFNDLFSACCFAVAARYLSPCMAPFVSRIDMSRN